MKILILLILAIAVASKEIKVHFVANIPNMKSTFDGYAYFDLPVDPLNFSEEDFLKAKIEFRIDGTAKSAEGTEAPVKGTGVIADPFMLNLDNIKVNGDVESAIKISFTGVCKVSILDVFKPKIPFKGHFKFSDGTEGDINGLIDRPNV